MPKCLSSGMKNQNIPEKEKHIFKEGKKRVGKEKGRLKCKIESLYPCTGALLRLSPKMLMEITYCNFLSIHKTINPILNFFQIDCKKEAVAILVLQYVHGNEKTSFP